MGGEFIPVSTRATSPRGVRIPGTSLTQSLALQMTLEKRVRQLPEVKDFFTRTGTAGVATDPMAPSMSDGYIMLSPHEWPNPARPRPNWSRRSRKPPSRSPAATTRSPSRSSSASTSWYRDVHNDVGIKVFGDDLDILQNAAAKQVQSVIKGISGATDVKTEQVAGLPILTVKIDRPALSLQRAQRRRRAGHRRDGDRRQERRQAVRGRPPLRHRAAAAGAAARSAPRRSARSRFRCRRRTDHRHPQGGDGIAGLADAAHPALNGRDRRSRAGAEPDQPRKWRKRRIVVTTNVRERDLGSFVAEAQKAVVFR